MCNDPAVSLHKQIRQMPKSQWSEVVKASPSISLTKKLSHRRLAAWTETAGLTASRAVGSGDLLGPAQLKGIQNILRPNTADSARLLSPEVTVEMQQEHGNPYGESGGQRNEPGRLVPSATGWGNSSVMRCDVRLCLALCGCENEALVVRCRLTTEADD